MSWTKYFRYISYRKKKQSQHSHLYSTFTYCSLMRTSQILEMMPNVKIKNNRYVEPNVRNINKWFSQVVVKWYIIFRHGNWNKKKRFVFQATHSASYKIILKITWTLGALSSRISFWPVFSYWHTNAVSNYMSDFIHLVSPTEPSTTSSP